MTQDVRDDFPLPSRLQLHARPEAQTVASAPKVAAAASYLESRPGTQRAIKGLAIALLGLTTIVVPLAGLLNASSSVSLPVKTLSGGSGGASWVETADHQIEQASLDASAGAASRTRVRTPLLATACLPTGAADGTRQVLRRSQVFWPLAPGTYDIVSGFSWRISPISGQLLLHEGVDMAGPAGTPIHAVADGTVIEVDENSRSGAYVVIEHADESGTLYRSAYLHQYMNEILVSVGDKITAGQTIGAVGNNGWSTGPHLHFEIRNAQDTPEDPVPFMENIGAVFIGQECS